MIEWIGVTDSSRVTAMAYDDENERILVRFMNGREWQYLDCPPTVWEEFAHHAASKGRYIHDVLDHHAHGPFSE